jgi:UDP-glucuronate decarboxylase
MITEISKGIYTAAFSDIFTSKEYQFQDTQVVDVRHLVDHSGNDINYLLKAIDDAKTVYEQTGTVVIACDKGISRSRVVAIGLLTHLGMSIDESIKHVLNIANNPEINADLLFFLRSNFLKDTSDDNQINDDVIVIGSNGFVGSSLSEYLSANSFTVDKISKKNLDVQTEQLSLITKLRSSNAKTVIFCAHPSSHHTANAMAVSVQMLKNTLEACRLGKKDLIFISGMVVFQGNAFQQNEQNFTASEKLTPIPKGSYSETKYLCEKLCDAYRTNYKMQILTVRPAGLYGPKMRSEWLIPKIISKAIQNQNILTHRYTNGLPAFELVHIEDFCDAIRIVLTKGIHEDSLNIGSHMLITTANLADIISKLCKSKSSITLLDINEPIRNIVSISGVLDQNGWKPKITLEKGLLSCISAIEKIDE